LTSPFFGPRFCCNHETLVMKAIVIALIVAGGALAETQAETTRPLFENYQARKATPPESGIWVQKKSQPNTITRKGFTFSGIAVQMIKTRKPLQLVNPLAPAAYGSGRDNFVAEREPITGRRLGWKFFSFEF